MDEKTAGKDPSTRILEHLGLDLIGLAPERDQRSNRNYLNKPRLRLCHYPA